MSGKSRVRASNTRPPAARAAQPAAATAAPDLPLQRLATSSSTSSHGALMSLQGTAGNRAVQRLLNETSVLEEEAPARESASTFNVPDAHLPAPGGGHELPDQLRRGMEGALGQDFSDVRMHTDSSPDSVGALAYTQGSDVHFRPGMYQPDSQSGREAIGHELAHVVQQRAGRVATPQGMGAPVNADPSLEAEADAIGRQAARAIDSGAALAAPVATSALAPEDAPAQRIAAPVQRIVNFHGRQRRGSVEALEQRGLVSGQRGIFEGGGAQAPGPGVAPASSTPAPTTASPTGSSVEVADIAASLPASASSALTAAPTPEATTPSPDTDTDTGTASETATDEAGLPEGADALAALGSDLPKMVADATELQSAVGSGDALETIAEGGESEASEGESEADASGMTSVPSTPSAIASSLGLPPPSTALPEVIAATDSSPQSVVEDGDWWNTDLDAMNAQGGRGGRSAEPAPAPSSGITSRTMNTGGGGGYEQPLMAASVAPQTPVVPPRAPIVSRTMNTGAASGGYEQPVMDASVAPPGYVPGMRAGYRENPFEAPVAPRAPITSTTMNTGTATGATETPVSAASVAPGPAPSPAFRPTGTTTSTTVTGGAAPTTVPTPVTPLRLMGRQGGSRNVRGTAEGNDFDDAALYTGVGGAVGSATGAASTTSQSLFGGSLHAAGQVANIAGGTSILGGVSSLAEAGSAAGAAHVTSGAAQAEEALRATSALTAAGASASNAAVGIESARLTGEGALTSLSSNATPLIQAAGTAAAGFSIAAGSAQVLGGVAQAVGSASRETELRAMAAQRGDTASGRAASATAETQRQRKWDGGVTAVRGAASVAGGAILLALGLTNPIGLGLLAGAAIAGGVYALYKWWRGKKNNAALHSTKPEKQAKQDLAVLLFQEGIVSRDTEYVAILIELGFNADKVMKGPAGGITAGKILSKIS